MKFLNHCVRTLTNQLQLPSGYRSEALCEAIGSAKKPVTTCQGAGGRPRNIWRA